MQSLEGAFCILKIGAKVLEKRRKIGVVRFLPLVTTAKRTVFLFLMFWSGLKMMRRACFIRHKRRFAVWSASDWGILFKQRTAGRDKGTGIDAGKNGAKISFMLHKRRRFHVEIIDFA